MSYDTEPTRKIKVPTPDAMDVKDAVHPEKTARTDRYGRGKQIGVVATIAGVLAAGGGGFMAYESHHKAPEDQNPNAVGPIIPGSTESATPNTVVTPNVSPSDLPSSVTETTPAAPETAPASPETATIPEFVKQYNTIDLADFEKLPVSEKLKYQSFYTEQPAFKKFITEYAQGSGNSADVYVEPSIDNTPEQIGYVNGWVLRYSLSLNNGKGTFDDNVAKRLWDSTSYYGYSTSKTDVFSSIEMATGGDPLKPIVLGGMGAIPMTPPKSASVIPSPETAHQSKKCWAIQPDSDGVDVVYCWTEYTDYQGKPASTWVRYDNNS